MKDRVSLHKYLSIHYISSLNGNLEGTKGKKTSFISPDRPERSHSAIRSIVIDRAVNSTKFNSKVTSG